jgi:hypothetical protein
MSGFMHKPDNSMSHEAMEEKVKYIYPYTGPISESGDFATMFFSGSATLGQMPLSPFC